jgi:hypothetical protein
MDAVVSDTFDRWLAQKHALAPTGDPFVDVRRGVGRPRRVRACGSGRLVQDRP